MGFGPGLLASSAPLAEATAHPAPLSVPSFLQRLLHAPLILADEWEALPRSVRDQIASRGTIPEALDALLEHKLLTPFQRDLIAGGKGSVLLIGNYRVLQRINAGGMGIIFKAEHVYMRRQVAIKVLSLSASGESDERDIRRFYAEVRAIARLQHPNIVQAIEAGETGGDQEDGPRMHYYVMEYVDGHDLQEIVYADGPLAIDRACDLMYEVASALEHADQQHLVHRDIKPSNILVTPDGQAKLVDFGLVRHFHCRMTEPGAVLGTVDYMAPEQARDASLVDIRADIYGLGATLFWCLTGKPPFALDGNLAMALTARQTLPPPSVRPQRPEAPAELDAVITRMMATRPDDRYPRPQAVMKALLPFLSAPARSKVLADSGVREAAGPRNGACHEQDELLNRKLLAINHALEQTLAARQSDLTHMRGALVIALSRLVTFRDAETPAHLQRMQRYCRYLAEAAAGMGNFGEALDADFVQMLECCAPLHDIGKVGLPDNILMKSDKLSDEERLMMHSHTVIGSDTVREVAVQHGDSTGFWDVALAVVRHHHERFDGTGYPDRLAGKDIPLAARIVSVCDVYDAVRCRRAYKPAVPHNAAVRLITEESGRQFDPALVQAFQLCKDQFEHIFRDLPG
jgi:response regulator RpfG family c-di-GMP phosphodiesterase